MSDIDSTYSEMETEKIICVDENDREIGFASKTEVHQKGLLHRAFSVFIFNSSGKMLIHRRALEKYHGGGLWSNACCSHPIPGQLLGEAVMRRLSFEMGMTCNVEKAFEFTYRAEMANGLIEHEYDHVYVGISDAVPDPEPLEVAEYAYEDVKTLKDEIMQFPEKFTPWFRLLFDRVVEHCVPETPAGQK